MYKKLLIFIPHINVGGVEKNFFLISNYLAGKFDNVAVITANQDFTKNLHKKIKVISIKAINGQIAPCIQSIRFLFFY